MGRPSIFGMTISWGNHLLGSQEVILPLKNWGIKNGISNLSNISLWSEE
jgi:hypothetical protein